MNLAKVRLFRGTLWVCILSALVKPCGAQVTQTLYARDVRAFGNTPSNQPNWWLQPGQAQGVPGPNCSDLATVAYSDAGQLWLTAIDFDPLVLPQGHVITRVGLNARARFREGPDSNSIRIRADLRPIIDPVSAVTPSWVQSTGDCLWRGGDSDWDITGLLPRRWTPSDINDFLYVDVRRETGSTRLRVDALRVVVTSELDSDGDLLPDSADPCPLDAANDADGDGRCGNADNCPSTYNPDQSNIDGDQFGDACDDDRDGDSISNASDCAPDDATRWRTLAWADPDGDGLPASLTPVQAPCFGLVAPPGFTVNFSRLDNCPNFANPDQADLDGDGIGDACDACQDPDRDGRCNGQDNCPDVSNPFQTDIDLDGIGDACDDDLDGDGLSNTIDPCVYDAFNDADGDGLCWPGDNCRAVFNPDQADRDADGAGDLCDSCPDAYNQGDFDQDGIDDACDIDEVARFVSAAPGRLTTELWYQNQTQSFDGVFTGGGFRSSGGSGGQTGGGWGGGVVLSAGTDVSIQLAPRVLSARASSNSAIGPGVDGGASSTGEVSMTIDFARETFYRLSSSSNSSNARISVLPRGPSTIGPGVVIVTSKADSSGGFSVLAELRLEFLPHHPDCPSDQNFDGLVDDRDFVTFAAAYDLFTVPPAADIADLTRDGFVDDADFVVFAEEYSRFECP